MEHGNSNGMSLVGPRQGVGGVYVLFEEVVEGGGH